MRWPLVKLESLAASQRHAFVGGPFGSKLTSADYVDEGVPVIRGSNLNGGRYLDMRDFAFVSETKMRQDLSSNLAHPGDMVFTQRGTLGQVAIIPDEGIADTYVVSQSQMKLTVDDQKADRLFLYYYFSNRDIVERIINLTSSSGVPHINLTTLRNFDVPLPPIEVQKRIADILSAYDELIENNRRRIKLLEEAARQLYREWFVRLRFPGHEHTKIVDGVPEGWSRKKLSDVAQTNAASYGAKELPDMIQYIDIASVSTGRINQRNRLSANEAPGRARRIGCDGDVIWSNVRPNLKAYALVQEPAPNDVFSTGFTVLSPTAVPFSFLYNFVTTEEFVGYLINHTTGASYPAVRPDDFERADLVVPTRPLLEEFHTSCEPNYRMVARLEAQNKKLAKARDLLLPRLMDGRIAA